jgi:hypothetical protein
MISEPYDDFYHARKRTALLTEIGFETDDVPGGDYGLPADFKLKSVVGLNRNRWLP